MPGEFVVDRIVVQLVGNASRYLQMLQQVRQATQQTMKEVDKVGVKLEMVNQGLKGVATQMHHTSKQMVAAGRSMSLAITAPLAGIGALGVREFAKFDHAMAKSIAIMGDIDDTMVEALTNTARAMVTKGIKPPEEVASAYFYLASAGKSAAQSIELIEPMLDFATAGSFDLATATDLATDAQSALGLSMKDPIQDAKNLKLVTDSLTKANMLANATIEQFSRALTSKAGASLKFFHKGIDEGLSALAAYADQGVKGELAGHSLTRVMLLLSKAHRDAADAHREYNFEVFDGTGRMHTFANIARQLETITGGMSDELRSATLETLGFEARIQQAILPLIGASDLMEHYWRELQKVNDVTEQVSDTIEESFLGQLTNTLNVLKDLAIQLGTELEPYMIGFLERVKDVVAWIKSWDEATRVLVVGLLAALAAIGPLLIYVGLLGMGAAATLTSFRLLYSALVKLKILGSIIVLYKKFRLAVAASSFTWFGFAKSGQKAFSVIRTSADTYLHKIKKLKTATQMAAAGMVQSFRQVGNSVKAANILITRAQAGAQTYALSTAVQGTAKAGVGNAAAKGVQTAAAGNVLKGVAGAGANTAAIKGLSRTVGLMGKLRGAAALAAGGVHMFAAELAAAGIALGTWVGFEIGKEIWGVNEFNDSLAESARLADALKERMDKAFQGQVAELEKINDTVEKRKQVSQALIEKEKKYATLLKQKKQDQGRVNEASTFWNKLVGHASIPERQQQLQETSDRAEIVKGQVAQLRMMLATLPQPELDVDGTPLTEAEIAARKLSESITKLEEDLQRQINTHGMTQEQIRLYDLVQQGATAADLQSARAKLQMIETLEAQAKAAKKVKEQEEDFNRRVEELRTTAATMNMSAVEAELYRLKTEDLTEAQRSALAVYIKNNHALQERKKLMEEGREVTKKYQKPIDTFREKQRKLSKLFRAGAIDADTFRAGMRDAIQEARKGAEFRVGVTGFDAVESGTAAAEERLSKYRAGKTRFDFNASSQSVVNLDQQNQPLASIDQGIQTLVGLEREKTQRPQGLTDIRPSRIS